MLNRVCVLSPLGAAGTNGLSAALCAHRASLTRRPVLHINADPSTVGLHGDTRVPSLANALRPPDLVHSDASEVTGGAEAPARLTAGVELEAVFGQLGALALETGHAFSVAHHLRSRLDALADGRETVMRLGPGMGPLVSALASTATAVVVLATSSAFGHHGEAIEGWLTRLARVRPDSPPLGAILALERRPPPAAEANGLDEAEAGLKALIRQRLLLDRFHKASAETGAVLRWQDAAQTGDAHKLARTIWRLIDGA